MKERQEICSDAAPQPVGPYSQAIAYGELVFASGQIPLDPETGTLVSGEIEAQTERMFTNLSHVLEAAGSSLDQVLRTSVYLTDLRLFPRMNEIYARYFAKDPKPARTTIEVSQLPMGALVEIDAIATTRL